jgi:hypothetical protein
VHPETVRERLREHAERTRREQLDRALSRLDGDLSAEQRDAVAAMSEAIVEGILALPGQNIDADDANHRAAGRLFLPSGERTCSAEATGDTGANSELPCQTRRRSDGGQS